MPRTATCTYHSGACGLHFDSLEAFDSHRVGDYRSTDPDSARRCVHPLDFDGRLAPLTVTGSVGCTTTALGSG